MTANVPGVVLARPLPDSPEAFRDAGWEDIRPWYDQLAEAPLADDGGNLEPWMAAWSRLDALIGEAGTQAMIAYTGNTADRDAEEAYLRFTMDIFPQVDEQQVRLARRLLAIGSPRDDLQTTLQRFRTDVTIFREANVARMSQVEELTAAYQKITGGLSVDWDGTPTTIPQLQTHLKSPDRAERERAFRMGAGAYLAHRTEMADLFDRLRVLRQAIAHEAGFADYQRYAFAAKHRFDYTPQDTARFHEAVLETVTPAVMRLMRHRQAELAVPSLRPWDLSVDLGSREPLRPFELGSQFRLMAHEGLLDLESRPGKAPGGYCTDLPVRRRPFIFMNAVGVPDDVQTLLHEAGHCFHDFATYALPFGWQRRTGHEAAELASMSMELLAMPYLVRPVGYYTPEQARVAWLEHLEDVLGSLTHIASVDAFQAWIYTSPDGADRDARDRQWLAIRSQFDVGVDWTGLERERVARWYRQLHIFELPFYYIEYGLAQLGALQVLRRALRDPRQAVADYKRFLALGGTRPLPELYATAGVRLVFDAPTMAELVAFAEELIASLRSGEDTLLTGFPPPGA
jgi:oligoendopeptidase F